MTSETEHQEPAPVTARERLAALADKLEEIRDDQAADNDPAVATDVEQPDASAEHSDPTPVKLGEWGDDIPPIVDASKPETRPAVGPVQSQAEADDAHHMPGEEPDIMGGRWEGTSEVAPAPEPAPTVEPAPELPRLSDTRTDTQGSYWDRATGRTTTGEADETTGDQDSAERPPTPEREPVTAEAPPEYAYNTVEIDGVSYERGETIRYTKQGEDAAKEYVVLCGTLDDESGIVLQSLENSGLVFCLPSELAHNRVEKMGTQVETSQNNEFTFRGEKYRRGDSIRYVARSGQVREGVVLCDAVDGDGMVIQWEGNDPENPRDDLVFQVASDGGEVTKIPTPQAVPSEEMPDLIAMSTDRAMSQEARARSIEERLAEKSEFDKSKEAWTARFPGVARSKVGRAMLSAVYSAAHPVQSIFRQNLLRPVIAEKSYQELIAGKRQAEVEFGETAEEATLRRLSAAQDAREGGEDWEAQQRLHGDTVLEQDTPEVAEFRRAATDLIKARVTGSLSQEDFDSAKERLMAETSWFRARNGGDGETVVHAVDSFDRVVEYLERLVATAEHTEALAKIDEAMGSMRLITGESHMGARSEAKLAWMDRMTDKITRSAVGKFIPDQVAAVAVAAAGAIATRGATSAASKALKWGTFGAGAAISGSGVYLRERLYLRQEESLVGRQLAYGEQGPDAAIENTPIRERMTESQMDSLLSQSAPEVIAEFQAMIAALPDTDGHIDMTSEQAVGLLDRVVAVSTALRWGDLQGRDVMRYSSRERLDEERGALDETLIQMRSFLQEHYEVDHPEQLPEGLSFDQLFEIATRQHLEATINPEASEKADSFNSFVQRRALTRAAITVAGGAIVGFAAKQVMEVVGDRIAGPNVTEIPGETSVLPNEQKAPFGVDFQMPKAWRLEGSPGGGGTSIIDSRTGQSVIDGLQTTEKGGLTAASIALLEQKGIKVDTMDYVIAGNPENVPVPTDGFVKMAGLPRIARHWMDNDTPSPNFDQNELRAYWRIEGDQLVIDAGKMKIDGSFHGGYFVNPQEQISAGNGKLLFSLDVNHQSTPLPVNIGTDGLVRLPVNGPEVQNLFDLSNGDIKLKSAFMEVATGRGTLPDGRINYDILATAKGTGTGEVVLPVPTEKTLTQTILTATETGEPTVRTTDGFTAPWLYLPIPMRLGLENIPRRRGEQQGEDGQRFGVRDNPDAPGPGERTPVDLPPGPGEQPPASVGNKWWEIGTDVPIDEEWQTLWTRVKDRMNEDGLEADDFWVESGARQQSASEIRELGPAPRPIAELPTRAESIRIIKESKTAMQITEGMLTAAGQDPEAILGDSYELSERLRQGRYTLEDLATLKAALQIAETSISARSDIDSFDMLRNIGSARDWFHQLERDFQPERQQELDIIYELVDDMKKFESLGFMSKDTRKSAFGLLGNMARRVREGKRLKPEEYQGLAAAIEQAAQQAIQANLVSEQSLVAAAQTPEVAATIRERCRKTRERLQLTAAARQSALRSWETLAKGLLEAGPVPSDQTSPTGEPTVESSAEPIEAPEITTPEPVVEPTPIPEAPPAPAGRRAVQAGDIIPLGGGRQAVVEVGPDGRLHARPIE